VSAVADAGPLIHLSWIDRLDLLPALFDRVAVPPAVRDEVLRAAPDVPGVAALRAAFAAGWLVVRPLAAPADVEPLLAELDRGEPEAIALMGEARADVLLLDERRGRAHAQRLGLPTTGTLGVLRLARDRGLVPGVAPLLDELRRRGFRIGADLVERIRQEEAAPDRG
jgi:predicted nucleic acid-binding protein